MGALRRWWPMFAVATLLVVAAASASLSALPITPLDAPAAQPASTPAPAEPTARSQPPESIPTSGSGWFGVAVTVVGLLVAGVVIVVIVRSVAGSATRFRRRMIRDRPVLRVAQLPAEEEVVAALDAGLLDLDDAATDPRVAVIACWVRLEQAAATVGVPRRPGDTATDLVVRMLAGHELSSVVLNGFADVYRRARFATHQVDESMREQARSALHRLRAELTKAAV